MLQKAHDDDERFNACNTLWTLAFDDENRKAIKGDESAMAELRKLLSSENSELRKAAAGALWESEDKEKHAEEKRLTVKTQEATGRKFIVYVSLFCMPSPRRRGGGGGGCTKCSLRFIKSGRTPGLGSTAEIKTCVEDCTVRQLFVARGDST